MKKKDLIQAIQAQANATNGPRVTATQVESVLEALQRVTYRELRNIDNTVTLPGLGTISVKPKAARTGRNPATGEPVDIAARIEPKFKPAKELKDALNQGR